MKSRFSKESLTLASILLLALLLRLWKWPDYLVFDYEKARDLIDSMSIYTTQNITLLGPTTEVEGVYHGPLYFYITGLFYFLTMGDPRAGAIISFGFNILGVLVMYFIGKDLFSKKVGLIAAFLYAVSFESISYAYWLSNPGPSVPFIFLTFYFFYKFLTSKYSSFNKFLPLSFLCFGLTIQFQILNLIFGPVLLIMYLFAKWPKFSLKTFAASALAFLIPISTFIIFELKYNFLMTSNTIKKILLPTSEGGQAAEVAHTYIPRLLGYSSSVFFPPSFWIGAGIFLIIFGFVIYQIWKKQGLVWRFLLIWILSTFLIFVVPSRMSASHAAFISVCAPLILVAGYLLGWLFTKSRLAVFACLAIILGANMFAIQNYLTNPQLRLFDYFQGLFLKTNLELIDYSYEDANGVQFKTDTITSPLSVSKLWDYLYDWRGYNKYGTVPRREGKPVIGYLILEPQVDVTFKDAAVKKADLEGDLVDTRKFGDVVIQKRILKY